MFGKLRILLNAYSVGKFSLTLVGSYCHFILWNHFSMTVNVIIFENCDQYLVSTPSSCWATYRKIHSTDYGEIPFCHLYIGNLRERERASNRGKYQGRHSHTDTDTTNLLTPLNGTSWIIKASPWHACDALLLHLVIISRFFFHFPSAPAADIIQSSALFILRVLIDRR